MRIATFVVVLAIHAVLLFLFAALQRPARRLSEAEAPTTLVLLSEPEATKAGESMPKPPAAGPAAPVTARAARAAALNSRQPSAPHQNQSQNPDRPPLLQRRRRTGEPKPRLPRTTSSKLRRSIGRDPHRWRRMTSRVSRRAAPTPASPNSAGTVRVFTAWRALLAWDSWSTSTTGAPWRSCSSSLSRRARSARYRSGAICSII